MVEKLEGFSVKGVSDLKFWVEEHPDKQEKRSHYFKALNAFELQIPRDKQQDFNITVDTRVCKIYAESDNESLGKADAKGWDWDAEALQKNFSDKVDIGKLKRDSRV